MNGDVLVMFKADVRPFVAAMNRAARAIAQIKRPLLLLGMTAGDRHIDRIVRDCAARRLPVDVTARRLMVASDVAAVLDGKPWQP